MSQRVLILTNYIAGLYSFRKELVETLIAGGYNVTISAPDDKNSLGQKKFIEIGCELVKTNIQRRGMNPLKDFLLFLNYLRLIKTENPDVVLSYTIKPNVFGGLACYILKKKQLATITGLGTSIQNKGLLSRFTLFLYKIGLSKTFKVFFQNQFISDFMTANKVVKRNKSIVIPGSGVNTSFHTFEDYPENGTIKFLFIGRIMKDKGVNELIEAAKIIKKRFPDTQFHIVGEKESDFNDSTFNKMIERNIIVYHGRQENIHPFIKKCHAVVIPSYHEGMCNVLLEGASTGRPVLATTVPGCIETFDNDISGIGFKMKSVDSLVEALVRFIKTPYEEKKIMGKKGRVKMEKEFDRKIVIDAYIKEIK